MIREGYIAIVVTRRGAGKHPATGTNTMRAGPFRRERHAKDWLDTACELDNRWTEFAIECNLYDSNKVMFV